MDKLLLYNVAKMYYIDQMGQQQIANIIGISRPQVSRLLKEAKASGIVHITLNSPFQTSRKGLSSRLSDALGIRKVHVVDTDGISPDHMDRRQELVTAYASDYMTDVFRTSRWAGIGWGSAVYHTVLSMQYHHTPTELCFAPLVGNAGMNAPHFQTNSIVDRIAEKFKADKVFLNAPAFIESDAAFQYIQKINGLNKDGGIWDRLDTAFFSLGVPLRLNSTIMGFLQDTQLLEQLLSQDCIGDLLGRFINGDGEFCMPEDSCGCVAIPLNKLQKVEKKICLAYGNSKAAVITAAARRFHVIDELITDDQTALAILELLEKDS